MTEQPGTAISETVPAQVGILGNPSDRYGGRTLAMTVPTFRATVTVEPSDRLEIEPADGKYGWGSVTELANEVDSSGYVDRQQLLVATIRTFADVLKASGQQADAAHSRIVDGEEPILTVVGKPDVAAQNSSDPGVNFGEMAFRLRYQTTIPRQVGLGGSSALVIACLRCLARFTDTEVPDDVLATIALRVETEQLGIAAGLQDSVAQTYGGLVAMDFSRMTTEPHFGVAVGEYTRLDVEDLPPMFVSYRVSASHQRNGYHRELRRRFENGDATVRETLRRLAALVVEGQAALHWKDSEHFAHLIGENMRLRRTLAPMTEQQLELVDAASGIGAQCTFSGSGAAIVGAYQHPTQLDRLSSVMKRLGAVTQQLN